MPDEPVVLQYSRLPAVLPLYVRAAMRLSDRWVDGDTMPAIGARIAGVTARPRQLARYRRVCGFAGSRDLPITYPHVWAFPLQLAVLTDRRFPLKLPGLVHVRNEIVQQRVIDAQERLDLAAQVGGHRDARRGLEFDLVTQARDSAGGLVWAETATMLSRRPKGGARGGKRAGQASAPVWAHHVDWHVPADTGRRYACAAGDINPIHLSAASARLFGFRRAIATGMWLNARVAAELMPQWASPACHFRVAFRKPVLLPSTVRLRYGYQGHDLEFVLTDRSGDAMHLQGQVSQP